MHEHFDIAVIGGGPAGMMAAGRAAELGKRVVLLEKNARLGKKLSITGGGRCNICNAEFDHHILAAKYGKKGKALLSAFHHFDAQSTIDFFTERGLPIIIEAEKRAFPKTEKSEDVCRVMEQYVRSNGVDVRLSTSIQSIDCSERLITKIVHDSGSISAEKVILATGGKSRPETGSTGDAFPWLRSLGHTIVEPNLALVPITVENPWVSDLAGIAMEHARIALFLDERKIASKEGKMLFTHTGLSGPAILNMSKMIGECLEQGSVVLSIDLFPKKDHATLDRELQTAFDAQKNRKISNSFSGFLEARCAGLMLTLSRIDGEKSVHQLTREERMQLIKTLKDLRVRVSGLLGTDKAIVTGGGVSLDEVDFRTMRSKNIDNLFLVGDLLDFDRPSGGFSLQICWSTGWIAGTKSAL
jgi:predicted Rossmann fold flavoprotein